MRVVSTPWRAEALKPSNSRPVRSVKRGSALERKEEGRTQHGVM